MITVFYESLSVRLICFVIILKNCRTCDSSIMFIHRTCPNHIIYRITIDKICQICLASFVAVYTNLPGKINNFLWLMIY